MLYINEDVLVATKISSVAEKIPGRSNGTITSSFMLVVENDLVNRCGILPPAKPAVKAWTLIESKQHTINSVAVYFLITN